MNFWNIQILIDNLNTILMAISLPVIVAYLNWRNNYKIRQANACVAFRNAIHVELSNVYPNISVWPKDIDSFLKSKFPAIQTAVENFRPFVPWYKKWFFERAWFIYRCGTGRKIDVQCYHHYIGFVNNGESQHEANERVKKLLHKNVKSVLDFANIT